MSGDIHELWLRVLAGEALTPAESSELEEGIRTNADFRRRLGADMWVDGALSALGRTARDSDEFVRQTVSRYQHEATAAKFVARTLENAKRQRVIPVCGVWRRWAIPLAAAASAAILAGAWWLAQGRQPAGLGLRVAEVQRSEVRVQRSGGKSVLAAVGMELRQGDRLTVARGGTAALKYDGEATTIELMAAAEAAFGREAGGKRVWLDAGRLTCSAAPQVKPFEIRTPHAVARVVGTRFGLDVTDSQSRLNVEDGRVAFAQGEKIVTVSAGRTAIASAADVKMARGIVYAWGANPGGVLGVGTTNTPVTMPTPVAGLDGVIAVAAGLRHSVALRSDGVYLWGGNTFGQLGDGTTVDRLTPALSTNFAVAVAIATHFAASHTVALMSDGSVRTCGLNMCGQLGDGTTVNRIEPVAVKLANGALFTGVKAIASGSGHTLALKNDGTVWTWGYNKNGQLGDNSNVNRSNPVQVQNLTGVMAIAGGTWHSLALKNDGTVWAWGSNHDGQLGDGTRDIDRLRPVQVKGLSNVVAIAGGGAHSIALGNDGAVWAWGRNDAGQCGSGGTSRYILTPSPVKQGDSDDPLDNVVAIAAGPYHNVALKNDGRVWTWGYNAHGACGAGSAGTLTQARQVPGIAGVTSISAGMYTTLAVGD